MVLKKGNRRGTRNPELIPGVRKYGRAIQSQKSQTYKKAKLGAKGKQIAKKVPAAKVGEPKFYSAEDVRVPLKSHHKIHPAKLRKSIQPGTVVILLVGRFRGKRVVALKQLQPSGLLLVSGPYKVNGVPLRRVNPSYVIATSTRLDVSKVDVKAINDTFFARAATKPKKDGEFFDKNEAKVEISAARKDANKKVDTALRAIIKATPNLAHYLNAKFTLTKGQCPHLMKF